MPKFQWPESEDHLGEWHVTIAGLRLVQQSAQQRRHLKTSLVNIMFEEFERAKTPHRLLLILLYL
jgi:hypothetical protein